MLQKTVIQRLNQINRLVIIATVLLCVAEAAGDTDGWNTKKSKHFIIYYKDAPRDYVSKVAGYAERFYRSITDYLGFRRFKFWTWDKRCRIYLYPSREEYLFSTGAASWSRGGVHVIRKEIITHEGKEQFLDYVLPHEMGHIIFREVVGYDKKLPLWIDEAVAVLQEKDRNRYLKVAKKIVEYGKYLPLEKLSQVKNYKKIEPLIFYSQSASIIDFLLEEYGRGRFISFCRSLRDGDHWQEALLHTYRFSNLEHLQQAWLTSIEKQ